jgi:hypothetical protein
MTVLIVSLACGAVACSRTIHALRSRVNVRSTCTSKECSGVLEEGESRREVEQCAAKKRGKGEIAHA